MAITGVWHVCLYSTRSTVLSVGR